VNRQPVEAALARLDALPDPEDRDRSGGPSYHDCGDAPAPTRVQGLRPTTAFSPIFKGRRAACSSNVIAS